MPAQPRGSAKPALEWDPLPHMNEFLAELEIRHPTTGRANLVRVGLTHFANFCRTPTVLGGPRRPIAHPDAIERMDLLDFMGWVGRKERNDGKPWSLGYQGQLLQHVRAWLNWMENLRYIRSNPWHNIRIASVTKKPNPLEEDELALLFEAHRRQAFRISPFYYHRREVILVAFHQWGIRVHELVALNVSNMDMRLEMVTAINKGGGTKRLPYGNHMKEVVQRYLRVRGQHERLGEDALLITAEGNRLSKRYVNTIVTELARSAGLVGVHPHRLRDTAGTTMLDQDMEAERVMRVLGHTNLKQTLAYSRVNDHKVKEAHDRTMDPQLAALLGDGYFVQGVAKRTDPNREAS